MVFLKINAGLVGRYLREDRIGSRPTTTVLLCGTICFGWVGINFVPQPVIGVSGGCDSSYLCYLAKEKMGLRSIAVHFDNTWNLKIAVENIDIVLKKLIIYF